jgi:hypothetical protein
MFGIHVPLVTQLGTTPVAWYNLHFGLMIVKVTFSFNTKSERNHRFCSELTRAWNTPGMVSPYVDVQQFLS